MENSLSNSKFDEREIFLLFDNLDIMIYTDHLPGLENSTADALCLLSLIGDYQIN